MNFNELPINVPDIKKMAKFFKKALVDLKNANDAESVTKIMKKINKYGNDISTDFTVIQIRYSIDTTNPEYAAANDKLSEIGPQLSAFIIPVEKEILNKPFRKDLEEIWGSFLFKKYENDVNGFDEKIIPELIEENKLSNEYDAVLGGAKIEYKGEIYNLSQMSKFAQSLDPEERKEASKLTEKFFQVFYIHNRCNFHNPF